jgi:hypothetical protein
MPEELFENRLTETALGLAVSAVRASLLPRVWILLAAGIFIDRPIMDLLKIERHVTARSWTAQSWDLLPESMRDFAEKAWLGPLGLVAPFLKLLEANNRIEMIQAFIGILFTVFFWGIIGAAICRIAITRMANRPIPGIKSSIAFAWVHRSAIWGPVLTLFLTSLVFFTAILLMGLAQSIPVIGKPLGWIFVPISAILSVFIATSMVGLVLGWPLSLGAAMAEAEDSFDALSRSQTYLFQAPVSWLWSFKIGVIVQAITWLVVHKMTWAIVCILKAGNSLFQSDLPSWTAILPAPWNHLIVSSDPIETWINTIGGLAACWPIAFEFAFAGALYLSLRQRVDGISPRVIFMPGQSEGSFYEESAEF